MTSRGNSSISPPVQISVQSQPRQVTALPSGTPPPQYYSGQPSSLPQAVYEFQPQNQGQQSGQPLLNYQAYGSTPNEIRVSSGSGRGGPPQQSIAQGGAFYQQPNQTMRPQQQPQTQQPVLPLQYYISTQPSNIRQQRPPQQTLFMLPPQATGLPATQGVQVVTPPASNVYSARVPLFTPPTGYQQYAVPQNPQYQAMYYSSNTGSMIRGPVVSQARAGPPQREKKLIEIKDPSTGRSLTEELCSQRPQSADSTVEEEPQNNQKGAAVQAEFARRVAEQLQTTPGSGNPGPPPAEQQPQASSENGLPNAHYQQPHGLQQNQAMNHPQQANQQIQPMQQQNQQMAPPQAQQQQKPAPPNMRQPQPHMMQPGQNPNMMQMGQDMMSQGRPRFNAAIPPPSMQHQVRPTAPIFIPQQQQHAPNQYAPAPPQQVQAPPQSQAPPHHGAPHHVPPQAQAPPQQHGPPPQSPIQHGPPQALPPHGPRHPQMAPQNMVRGPAPQAMPPSTPPPQQHMAPPVMMPAAPQQQPLQQPPPQQAEPTPAPQPAAVSVPSSPDIPEDAVPSKTPLVRENSAPQITAEKPEREATPPQVTENIPTPTPPVSRENSASPPKEAAAPIPAAGEPAATKEMSPPPAREDSPPKSDDSSSGASIQPKDGRKNKKKKDFNRKDIGGSEMDAFIDKIPPPAHTTIVVASAVNDSSNNHLDSTEQNEEPQKPNEKPKDTAIDKYENVKKTLKNEQNVCNSNNPESVKDVEKNATNSNNPEKLPEQNSSSNSSKTPVNGKGGKVEKPPVTQAESKHKAKKNKKNKKKGRKASPVEKEKPEPPVKEKPEPPVNEKTESPVNELQGKDGESVEAKPPLPPAPVERQTSAEKSPITPDVKPTTPEVKQEVKPVFSYAAAATKTEKPKETSPQPPTPTESKKPVIETVESDIAQALEANKSPDVNQNRNPQQKEKSPTPVVVIEPAASQDVPEAASPKEAAPEPEKPKEAPAKPAEPVQTKSEPAEKSVNDENVPPPQEQGDAPVQSKADVQVVPKVTRDENGRLVYDRSYLMELRGTERSQARPSGLPDLEIILDTPMQNPAAANKRGSSMTGSYTPDFAPSYFQAGIGNQRHAPPIGKSSSRGRPGDRDHMGGRMGPPQKIITRQSMGNDVKPLHQAENAWVPTAKKKVQGGAATEEDKKSLEQATLFIMNRLTPTNFERLAGEMRKLAVNTYEDLQELIKIFFDKVTIETKFVSAYAQLCKVMAGLKVPPPAGLKENQATFRVVMLTKCQQEFEADKSAVFEDPEKKRKELEAELPADDPKKAEKIDFTLYQMKLRRLKFYGNIRFIGELFKLGMLTENIMHDCIFRLLKARDDDSLVSLCNLVSTVGKHLDTEKAKARMDQYFNQMQKIAEERKSRIKFTLKDVLELRRNCWVPRKGETGPKKIDDVHKDFAQEQATKQFLQNQPPPPRNEPPQNNRRNSRQRQDEKPPTDDGWNTVGSRAMKLDPGKLRLSKPTSVDENSIQLGPGGGMAKFGMWSRGSFGGSSQQPSQDERQQQPNNRFNALRDDKGRQFERSPSRENAGRGLRPGTQSSQGNRRGNMSRSSQEGERRDLLNSARNIVGPRSQNSSRDNSWNREDRRQTFGPRSSHERDNQMTRSDITPRRDDQEFRTPAPPAPTKRVKEMSDDEMESKAKNILEEYLNIRDLAEAKLCVSELAGQPRIYLFVTASLNDVLEKKVKDRELTGQLLNELIKSNHISLEAYTKGLNEVTMYAEDMVIDIPTMWTNLAQVITPLLAGGSLPMDKLLTVLKTSMETKRCIAQLLAEVMLEMKEKVGEDATAQKWQSSGTEWSAFIPAADVDGFLKDKKIQFVTKSLSGGSDDGKAVWQKLSEDVEAMIRAGKPNNDIFAFVEKSAGKEVKSKDFIRSLTTAVASSSISKPPSPPKASEDIIKARKDLLQRYINSNPAEELQALYAIQALMTKLEHPSGVISCLFDTLYDEEVISEESCRQWEKSSDPAEQEGKGVCSMQLTQFFTWLSENDEMENS